LLGKFLQFFPPAVLRVTDGVYVARGYNRDNPTLIEGKNGLIVVDPGESIPAAQAAKAAFNAELDGIFDRKPVKAITTTTSTTATSTGHRSSPTTRRRSSRTRTSCGTCSTSGSDRSSRRGSKAASR
jgi:hypothetical protein